MNDTRGFTLLELLMVVIIIAILASIALPQYLRVAERSRASEALTVLAAMRSSELRFKAGDPLGNYAKVDAGGNPLDTDFPGYAPVPASPDWAYTVNDIIPGTNALATRSAGSYATNTIELDLDGGASCATNAVWGLATGAC